MVSAEKQPAETAHHGRQLLLSSNINSKLRAVDHTDPASEPTPGGALSLFFLPPLPSPPHWTAPSSGPGRLTLATWRGNENCQAWMCLKRRTLFTAHKHWLPASAEALSLYAPFIKGGKFVFSFSLCLQSATSTPTCSVKPILFGAVPFHPSPPLHSPLLLFSLCSHFGWRYRSTEKCSGLNGSLNYDLNRGL